MVEAANAVYLVHFRRHIPMIDFCLPELEALVSIFGLKVDRTELYVESWETLKNRNLVEDPTVYIRLPAAGAEKLCKELLSRSILIKEIVDVFADIILDPRQVKSEAVNEIATSVQRYTKLIDNVDQSKLLPLLS
jgi:hypothetical protein